MQPSTPPPVWPPSPSPPIRRRVWPWIVIPTLSVLLIIIAGVLTLEALGPAGTARISRAADPLGVAGAGHGLARVWVGSDSADAYMIQVTRQGAALSGTYDATWLATSTQATSVHAAFSGVIDGNAITLSFPEGLGFVSNVSGTVSTTSMVLQMAQTDGTVSPLSLKPSTIDDFNRRVASVRDAADVNTSASAAAAVRQQTQEQIDAAAATVGKDVDAVHSADQAPDFSDFDSDLAAATKDLAQTKTDAGKAAGETDPGDACYDAGSAAYDAGSVQYDSGSIDYDANGVKADSDAVHKTIDSLSADLATYQRLSAAMPSYQPVYVPDPTAVRDLEDQATKAAAGWKTKASKYQSEVAKLLTQANAVAAQAQKQYC